MRATLVAILAFAGPVFAQSIYTWTDETGEHFTNDVARVPHQGDVKVRVTTGDFVSTVAVERLPAVALVVPAPVAVLDESAWRATYRAARLKVRELEDGIEAQRRVIEESGLPVTTRMHCSVGTGLVVASGQLVGSGAARSRVCGTWHHDAEVLKLEVDRRALVRAREELAELDRRAAFEAVPLEWRR